MAIDGTACRILIQNEQLEQLDTFAVSVPRVPNYRGWLMYDEISYRVKQEAGDRGIPADMEKSQHIDFNIRLMKVLVWLVATYGRESWTLRKNEETRLDAFEMKGLRNTQRFLWTAKKTNEWVLNKTGVKRDLLDTVKGRKLAYSGQTMRKQGWCLEKEITQGTMSGARRRGRPRMAWMDNINTRTELPVEESIRMTENGDKRRKYVHGVAIEAVS